MMSCDLISFLVALTVLGIVHGRILIFQNNLPETIWVGSLGKAGKHSPNNGGWTLTPGQQSRVLVEETWSGRFWARTGCQFDGYGYGYCETGDCSNLLQCKGAAGSPPATLAEFTLTGWQGQDYYDVSHVEGFNVPITITPLTAVASPYNPLRCGVAGCKYSLLTNCPSALKKYNYRGKVVGCKSACIAFNTDQYCCSGPYANAQYCDPSRWSINFASYFKNTCPGAYSYAMDDSTSLYSCVKNNYRITFG